jgi:cobalt-zinc-cadmium efflux system outer membrane protein
MLVACILTAPPTLKAQDGADARAITMSEAVALFGRSGRQLTVARLTAAARTQDARQGAAYPNPVVAVTHESLRGGGASASETYLNLTQTLRWPQERAARSRAARAIADESTADVYADSIVLVAMVKRQFVYAVAAERRAQVWEEAARVFREVERRAQQRVDEGELSGYELRRIRIERQHIDDQRAVANLDVRDRRRALTLTVTGDAAPMLRPAGWSAPLPGPTLPTPPVDMHPRLAAADAAVAAAEAQTSAVRWSRIPALAVTGGYKRQSDSMRGVFLGVQLPVPLFSRSGAATAAAAARVGAAREARALTSAGIDAEIAAARERVVVMQERMASAVDTTERRELFSIAEASYDEGALGLTALLDAANVYRAAALRSIDRWSDAWDAWFELERALGVSLPLPRGEGDES